ncbi:hypothetical protein DFJ74DRAFT_690760 [Hyaloraphidium curvatum]|nr:hypothetical protein DFJ74DRAFT_690760 [Hyaloraphidium curvatum]
MALLLRTASPAKRALATIAATAPPPPCKQSPPTALHTAAQLGDVSLAAAILRSPAASRLLSTPNHEHLTALHLAAGNGHYDVVELLLQAGASPAVTTPAGVSPRHLAEQKINISNQYKKVVELLSKY